MINESSASQINDDTVTAALNAILATDKFSASPQMSAFLKYVVEQTLLGNTRRIKAFTVGIEALGKSSSFDPQTDPSVRVLAKRLRSSLDAYYEQNLNTMIYIEMKPGSYIPKFLLRSEMIQSAETTHTPAVGYQHATAASLNATQPLAPSAPPASPGSAPSAHVSVPQQQQPRAEGAAEVEAESNASEVSEEAQRKAGITQLWQAYKSASKVA